MHNGHMRISCDGVADGVVYYDMHACFIRVPSAHHENGNGNGNGKCDIYIYIYIDSAVRTFPLAKMQPTIVALQLPGP
jgi:hypothetical protein